MSAWDDAGYDQEWGGKDYQPPPPGGDPYGGGDDTNQAGASADPFAYTKGSLLTPWEGKFSYTGGSGGSGVADYTPFQYADFKFDKRAPAGFDEKYGDPGDFRYNDYTGPEAFRPTTAADMEADPGYQARQDAGRRALEASAAKGGVLRTGGTLKGLQKQGSDVASQEFANVDARRKGEYAQKEEQGKYTYGVNRANASENFNTNVDNKRQGYGIRQNAWKDNAANTLAGNEQEFGFYSAGYDRNEAKARQGYDDAAAHAQAVASAGAAGSSRDYERALDEYKMSRDEFYTNQDRQYNILDREDVKGRDATERQADREYRYGSDMAENTYQTGNARSDARAGQAQAAVNGYTAVGDAAAEGGMYAYGARRPAAPAPTRGGAIPYGNGTGRR